MYNNNNNYKNKKKQLWNIACDTKQKSKTVWQNYLLHIYGKNLTRMYGRRDMWVSKKNLKP